MEGLDQPSLFSESKDFRMDVVVPGMSRYRMLATHLPWKQLGETANCWRAKKVNIHVGRPLNLRLHLGALISQSMNGWTDRETEEMVKYHAGVRVLCALECSQESIDHTSIETFRNQLTSGGVEAINRLVIQVALRKGYTDVDLCSSDTTVQESPIEYPTEVGHMRKISQKLKGMAKKLGRGLFGRVSELGDKVEKFFTNIRLFARGKGEKAVEKKKKLSLKMHSKVRKMLNAVRERVDLMRGKSKESLREELKFYEDVMGQIWKWLNTGFHPKEKVLSLWERGARAISKGKLSKPVEFGRRWLVSIMTGGYTMGRALDLGAGNDMKIAPEAITNFLETTGELPQAFVYDRGGDSEANHEFLEEVGIEIDAIFCKGKKSLKFMSDKKFEGKARQMRATSEASIATMKHPRYKFNKPQAKSSQSCVLKGHSAILGTNLTRLYKDLMGLRPRTC
jgi:hypothetical protein